MFRQDPFANVIPPYSEPMFQEAARNYYPEVQDMARRSLWEDARNARIPESRSDQWLRAIATGDENIRRSVHAIRNVYYVKARELHKKLHLKSLEQLNPTK